MPDYKISTDAQAGSTPNLRADYLTRREAAQATGFSFSSVDRHLPRVKVGRKVLIPVEAVRQLRRRLASEVQEITETS